MLRQLCEKRLAVLPPPTPRCAAAAAAAVVTYGHLISVFLKKYAVLRDANRSFLFSIRDFFFFFWSDGISAIRSSQTQSDAGMNLAFFKFDGIVGLIIFIANTLLG